MFSVMEVKRDARGAIRAAIGSVILVSFVYVLITELLAYLSAKVLYGDFDMMGAIELMLKGEIVELPQASAYGELLDMAMTVMNYVIAVGFAYVALLISRRQKAGVGELFDVFTIFLRALCLVVLQNIFIALWSMLFIIPGIIAAYRYSMAVFIMLERPELSIMDCLRESKEMTRGFKGKLFLLDLSFILWQLANIAVGYIFMGNPIVTYVCSGLISVVYMPYYHVSLANVYNILSCWKPQPEAEPIQDRDEPIE